jgi:Gram-negative bacterial TonB protein C-terminal
MQRFANLIVRLRNALTIGATIICMMFLATNFTAQQRVAVASVGGAVAPSHTLGSATWSSPAMDSFAAQIGQRILKKHIKTVLVIGACGTKPDGLTQEGQEIGDAFSAALTKQANGFQLVDRAELRAFAKRNGVSEVMTVSDVLANWITRKTGMAGYAVIQISSVSNGRVTIAASLYKKGQDEGDLQGTDKTELGLSADQEREGFHALNSNWNKPTFTIEETTKLPPDRSPRCISCPYPPFTETARRAGPGINETVALLVTVFPNGRTGDIAIVKPARYGLNASVVETILYVWRFKPGLDEEGKAGTIRTVTEINYYIK